MRVLVVGSGGREHALIRSLLEDSERVYSLPERLSVRDAHGLPSALLSDRPALSARLKSEKIDLAVIGPEQPLADGLADFLRAEGLAVFGPSAQSARLEASKIFAKKFMKRHGIPTASWREVSGVSQTLQVCESFCPPFVLKADGLAGGKGVFLCKDHQELEQKARLLFEKKALGQAGQKALLEDFQKGHEMSVFVITDGKSCHILPPVRDYKKLWDGGKGPNTGGMGAVAPISVSADLMRSIEELIIGPTLKGLREEKIPYRGVLYFGLMVHKNFPKVLEYNVRFGDPEAQALLPLLDGSWRELFYKTARGQMAEKLKWKKLFSACVVLCHKGYPEGPLREEPITGFIYHKKARSWFVHGGLIRKDDRWWTASGRVLSAVAVGNSHKEAVAEAYRHAGAISWPGLYCRKDIGA